MNLVIKFSEFTFIIALLDFAGLIDVANSITSAKFIKKYNLNSASAVQAAIKLLLRNDIITKNENSYRVYDYFFAEWLAKVY